MFTHSLFIDCSCNCNCPAKIHFRVWKEKGTDIATCKQNQILLVHFFLSLFFSLLPSFFIFFYFVHPFLFVAPNLFTPLFFSLIPPPIPIPALCRLHFLHHPTCSMPPSLHHHHCHLSFHFRLLHCCKTRPAWSRERILFIFFLSVESLTMRSVCDQWSLSLAKHINTISCRETFLFICHFRVRFVWVVHVCTCSCCLFIPCNYGKPFLWVQRLVFIPLKMKRYKQILFVQKTGFVN